MSNGVKSALMRPFSVVDQLKVVTPCVDDNGEGFEFVCFSCFGGDTEFGAKEFGDRRFQ